MPEIISADGTRIAWETTGSGRNLLLVHGTTSERERWQPVRDTLSQRYRVHALDRRGRGGSSDAPEYALAREFEDVAAVADAIGAPVHVLGHSYGAIAALEASRLTDTIVSLILYEAPIDIGPIDGEDPVADELDGLIAVGDREGALLHFYRSVLKLPDAAIAQLRARPNWPARIALAHTIAREIRAARRYRLEARRFAETTLPTLLLLGGDSLPRFRIATELLETELPGPRTVVLPGQQHQAIDTAPGLFAREVLAFLDGLSEPTR